ncbi:Ankyrin repeat domain-containing protein 1 [Hondaea fermentalgiana]|uniref:Ankyrin repeat domain-containing protein 1 n=1 Tax=Hondaea fermentalgiana TaxID=2315210 RepID=A0A2R5GR66_9STRA|nr:Ankyrin repeat domain-containing protein 1 [Hondaea fermentalgiana]|eukprot:GBG33085.1 Ankyrin repeat domain-containing protein 1 [Hondaea fermentalgiana]
MSDESDDEVILLQQGAAPASADNGENDGSDESDDDDDLSFLRNIQQQQGGVDKVLVQKDPYLSPTRAVTMQYRAEKEEKAQKDKRSALHALTLKNMRAAETTGWQSPDEENATAEADGVEIQLQPNDAAETNFSAIIEAGKAKIKTKDWEGAKAVLQQGIDFCAEHPDKQAWRASVGFSMGSVLLQLGDVRLAIGELNTALQAVRACPPATKGKLEAPLLQRLVQAYSDIGKMSDADACQRELDSLGTSQGANKKAASSSVIASAEDAELPEELTESLDQAIEAAIKGHFGFLRALLNAFRDGRGEVSLSQVVNYQHSATLATPLMVATAKGELHLVQALVHAGAQVNAASADGSSALLWACKFNQPQVLRTLLDAGAQFDASITPAVMESWSPAVQQAIADFVTSRKNAAQQQQQQQQQQQTQQKQQKQQKQAPNKSKVPQQKQHKKPAKKGKSMGGERNLEKWKGDAKEAPAAAGLGDEPSGDWDQFKANEALGVHANSFDENLYTTKLDIDSIPADVQAQADALCEAMQREKSANPRAQKNPDADEEALYSAVARSTEGAAVDDDGFTDASVLSRKQKKAASRNAGSKKKPASNSSKSRK